METKGNVLPFPATERYAVYVVTTDEVLFISRSLTVALQARKAHQFLRGEFVAVKRVVLRTPLVKQVALSK